MEEKMVEKELEEFKKAQSKKIQPEPQNLNEKVDSTLLKKHDLSKELNFKPSVKFKKSDSKKRSNDPSDDNVQNKKAKKENNIEEPVISLVAYDFVDDDDE